METYTRKRIIDDFNLPLHGEWVGVQELVEIIFPILNDYEEDTGTGVWKELAKLRDELLSKQGDVRK